MVRDGPVGVLGNKTSAVTSARRNNWNNCFRVSFGLAMLSHFSCKIYSDKRPARREKQKPDCNNCIARVIAVALFVLNILTDNINALHVCNDNKA